MPLIETVITVLGGAIAKNIVGDWLKDSPLAEKIGDEIVDVIKDTFGDSRSAARARREIDKLGTEITERMRVVLDTEVRSLHPGALAAIQYETVEALRTTVIDLPLLVQFNFDGNRLARHISGMYKINRAGLSADELGLYRRLVQEASYGIVATAGQLRDFDVQSTASILDRIDSIISQTVQLLERERREAEDFEQRYRTAVEREFDRMETFGIPRMDRVTTRQKLSAAYITLAVSHFDNQHISAPTAAFSRALANDELVREGLVVISESTAINNVLAHKQRFAIRGEAGAGKSTLLQWIAVRAATRSFPPDLAHWNSAIPFFIRLRALVNKSFPSIEEFPGLISQNFKGDVVPRRWVDQLLRRGQALILIDGIDELPRLQRAPFFESLRRLVADYPAATYIVTSRPSGLKDRYGQPWQEWEDWVNDEAFTNLTIERMSQPTVELFITRWHEALAAANRPDDQQIDLVRTGKNLNRLLRQRPELRRMSTTPLICAMICALHRERGETLPHGRIRLYEECVALLLSRRDEARHIALDDIYPAGLNDTQKDEAIQSLAYWMLENSYASVEVARVDGHFERLIPQLRLSPTMTGAMLREFFVGRAGLLREPVMGIIDFAHRSFQEFLAAREALAEDDIGVLITKAHDDQWREVILVAVGLARPREREELLRGLMDRGDREPHNRAYLHLLAVACLETSGRLEPEITKAAIERAQQLVPPQDADTARLIAGAGDAIVPLLAPNIDYSEQEIILCIDTLGQIGTSTAMAAIATYASSEWDNNIPPIGSFGAAWDYFDRLSYAKNVLASFKQLSLNNINSLEGFEFLTELESLYLELTVPVDLTLLTKLSKLKELGVSYAPGTNLEPLTTLVGLNYLGLNSNKLGELSWLSELRTLQSFSVGSIELGFVSYAGTILKTFDLRLLSVFTCLQNLFIHVRDVIDISPIVELSQLTTLQLRASSIENITMLKEPNQLRHLQIISSAGVDLAQLTGCTQLTSLALGMHRMNGHSRSEGGILIKHFKCIRDFSDLKSLALCVESIDLSPVGELAALEELVLWIWESLDLTPLRGLSTLYTLHIWDVSSSSLGEENHLQPSITGIEHLTMLRKLSFEISDSSARFPIHLLVNLINLEELALGIQDMTPEEVITLARLPKLRKLTLFDHSDLDLREFYEKPGFELVLL